MTSQDTSTRQAEIHAAMDRARQMRSDAFAEFAQSFLQALRDAPHMIGVQKTQ